MKSMLLLLTLLLSACSADLGRALAEKECSKIRNNADRDQCYKDVERTFRDY